MNTLERYVFILQMMLELRRLMTFQVPFTIQHRHFVIPHLGNFFGSNDDIPSLNDDGIWIRSSANYSFFIWDHGKHEHHFQHSSRRLPELTLATGFNYFSSFCTRVRYIHFAFLFGIFILLSCQHSSPQIRTSVTGRLRRKYGVFYLQITIATGRKLEFVICCLVCICLQAC